MHCIRRPIYRTEAVTIRARCPDPLEPPASFPQLGTHAVFCVAFIRDAPNDVHPMCTKGDLRTRKALNLKPARGNSCTTYVSYTGKEPECQRSNS